MKWNQLSRCFRDFVYHAFVIDAGYQGLQLCPQKRIQVQVDGSFSSKQTRCFQSSRVSMSSSVIAFIVCCCRWKQEVCMVDCDFATNAGAGVAISIVKTHELIFGHLVVAFPD